MLAYGDANLSQSGCVPPGQTWYSVRTALAVDGRDDGAGLDDAGTAADASTMPPQYEWRFDASRIAKISALELVEVRLYGGARAAPRETVWGSRGRPVNAAGRWRR